MEFVKRKPTRLFGYDYSSPGAYFITICTKERKCILSRIVGGDVLGAPTHVELLAVGKILHKYINQMNSFYKNVSVDKYVIMPNHIHLILSVAEEGASRTSPPTRQHSVISGFVSTLKRFCNKECGENIWQRSFHDHIIRGDKDYQKIWEYIDTNAVKWKEDIFFAK